MKFIILFFAFFLPEFAISSGVDKCNRVNLLRYNWFKLRQMPIYNQGASNLCYSYTAIQMLDYWRETYGLRVTKKMDSSNAIYGALLGRVIQINKLVKELQKNNIFADLDSNPEIAELKKSMGMGHVENVIEGIRTYGMCDSHTVNKSLENFAIKNNIDPQLFEIFSQYFFTSKEYLQGIGQGIRRGHGENILAYLKQDQERIGIPKSDIDEFWSSVNFSKMFQAIEPYLRENNYLAFLENTFRGCFEKENIHLKSKKLPPLSTFVREKTYNLLMNFGEIGKKFLQGKQPLPDHKFIGTILDSLNKKERPQPIGMGYCSKFLKSRAIKGISENGGMIDQDCEQHASLIVGKRTRNNRCQFLIRDSLGSQCNYDWDCLTDEKGKTLGIWVDSEALMNNLYFIYKFDLP